VIWTTHNRSLAGQQGISSPVSLLAGLLAGLGHPHTLGENTTRNNIPSPTPLDKRPTPEPVETTRVTRSPKKERPESPRSLNLVTHTHIPHNPPTHNGHFLQGNVPQRIPHTVPQRNKKRLSPPETGREDSLVLIYLSSRIDHKICMASDYFTFQPPPLVFFFPPQVFNKFCLNLTGGLEKPKEKTMTMTR